VSSEAVLDSTENISMRNFDRVPGGQTSKVAILLSIMLISCMLSIFCIALMATLFPSMEDDLELLSMTIHNSSSAWFFAVESLAISLFLSLVTLPAWGRFQDHALGRSMVIIIVSVASSSVFTLVWHFQFRNIGVGY